jgi:hypothetical protein
VKLRTLLLGLSALFVAFNAAFFSVSGLSKLFAGASLSVILMASSLELAKLIVAGYLYNYWEKINKLFRVYLIIGTSILVLITSLGIYGFLTSAFQDTFNVYSITSKQKAFLQQKEKFWGDDVTRYDKELERISENINTLSNAKSTQIQVKDTTSTTGFRTTVSTAELRVAQSRISVEEQNRKDVQSKRQVAADSLQSIQLKILELDTNTEVGSELGPLQYLSGLLNKPMDQIINWFILIIIFVFDPLAVALVVAFNNALKIDKGEDDKKKISGGRKLYGEVEDHPKDEKNDDFGSSSELLDESTIAQNIIETNDFEDWDVTLNDGLDDIEVRDAEEIPTSQDFIKTLDKIEKEQSKKKVDEELLNLKSDTSKRPIDIDGDGTVDGYDTDGDGLIDVMTPGSATRWRYVESVKPYYARKDFDWSDKSKWINDQNAVNYWIRYVKPNKYPDDFTSKTY